MKYKVNITKTIITKASSYKELFNANKLRESLTRSSADENTISEIISQVQKNLYDNISTKEIYQLAFGLLKKESRPSAAKYKLKQAIMELGPSGFPIEKYIAEILRYQGFKVQVGVVVKGHCVNHGD